MCAGPGNISAPTTRSAASLHFHATDPAMRRLRCSVNPLIVDTWSAALVIQLFRGRFDFREYVKCRRPVATDIDCEAISSD